MLGIGDAQHNGQTMPAAAAVARAGLSAATFGPKEGLALLNGTQFSTAEALAGLFAIERAFQQRLVTGALSDRRRPKGSERRSMRACTRCAPSRPDRGRRGIARADERAADPRVASHHDDRVQDPYCLRCQPQVMGAVLDLLRQAAATLGTEANGVSDNPLIFAETNEALSGGNFHASLWPSPPIFSPLRSARSARSPSGASPC